MDATNQNKTVDKILDFGLPLLVGAVALNVVLLLGVFLVVLLDPASSSTGGLIFARVLLNPGFWVVSIAAFGWSFYLAR